MTLIKYVTILIIVILEPIGGQLQLEKANSTFTYNSYYFQVITCHSSYKPFRPSSLQDLQELVAHAIQNGLTLKALGNRHSLTDLICTDGVPISMRQINHFRYNPETGIASIGAGSTLQQAVDNLHKVGRTITGLPTCSKITVGGAIAGGSHGTAKLSDSGSVADQLVGVVVIDGLGNTREISDPEVIRGFKGHLGLLGIVYEARFKTIPQHKLRIKHFTVPDTLLFQPGMPKIMDYLKNSGRFQFWWFPSSKQVVLSVGNRVSVKTPGLCENHYMPEAPRDNSRLLKDGLEMMQAENNHLGMFILQGITRSSLVQKVPGRSPFYSEPKNANLSCLTEPPTGFSHTMTTNMCNICAWDHGIDSVPALDLSVGVPLDEMEASLKEIQQILKEYPTDFPLNGILVRFLQKGDGLMMMNGGRDTVVIEWVLAPRNNRYRDRMMGTSASQAITQALIWKHQGRPHWTKNGLYYTSQEVVQKAFPDYPKFREMLKEFDPNGIFLNEFGRRIRYGSKETSIDHLVKYCGIVDHCICEVDSDCGDGKKGSLICGKLNGYNVCREKENAAKYDYSVFRGNIVRDFIRAMKMKLV